MATTAVDNNLNTETEFVPSRRLLHAHVKEVKGIPPVNKDGSCDIYVIGTLINDKNEEIQQETFSSSIVHTTLYPLDKSRTIAARFGETFCFGI